MITVTDISKSYGGKPVLDGVNFSASYGESAVIVGRNGSGKSTLLSILAGYLLPDKGTVTISCGKAAFCPQDDNLFEDLTVRDNILFWTRAQGGSFAAQNAENLIVAEPNAPDLVRLFGADAYLGKRVRHLSGGMKKSVAIICALTNNSPVFILDEPFSGLDIFYKSAILGALAKLKSMGKCIIYTSHNIDEIAGLDSQIYTLAQGKLSHMYAEANASLLEAILSKI